MSPWANFALGFTYLSPVVGIYTLFALGLATGGPPMIWWLVIVGARAAPGRAGLRRGRLAVPGGGRRLPVGAAPLGRRWAWMTGWVYLVALLTTIAGVVYGSGPYLAQLLGFEAGTGSTITCALILLASPWRSTCSAPGGWRWRR